MALLCLSLTEGSIEENLQILEENRQYVDVCELRADFLSPEDCRRLAGFPAAAGVPVILTLRGKRAGGAFGGDDGQFCDVVLSALQGEYRYVDIDTEVHAPEVASYCRKNGITVIRSSHHFSGIPDDAAAILQKLPQGLGDIPKIACMINSIEELFRLAEVARNSAHKRQIIIGMGEFGIPTRLLPEHFGSMLSYATAGSRPAAPGHIAPAEMVETYRFREIHRETSVFGIIGNPVLHSKSPALHNPGFRRCGIHAVYVPFPTDAPETFLRHARELPGRGFSVTAPFKEVVAELLTLKEDAVSAIGSCNTVIWQEDEGAWKGYNTDYTGFYRPLAEYVEKTNRNIHTATVIGAGGAARAVLYALVRAGIQACIINRTPGRAKKLAREYGIPFGGMDSQGLAIAQQHADMIVQTTSAGMEPDTSRDPWPEYSFSGRELVYEIIYRPLHTVFASRAAESGCDVITGDRMLAAQGEEQFFLFTGKTRGEC